MYRKNGIYLVSGENKGSIQVRCDMNTKGGGWTIFQRRFNGSVDFSRKWEDYKFGLGQMDSEFWLGLKEIYRISNVDKSPSGRTGKFRRKTHVRRIYVPNWS